MVNNNLRKFKLPFEKNWKETLEIYFLRFLIIVGITVLNIILAFLLFGINRIGFSLLGLLILITGLTLLIYKSTNNILFFPIKNKINTSLKKKWVIFILFFTFPIVIIKIVSCTNILDFSKNNSSKDNLISSITTVSKSNHDTQNKTRADVEFDDPLNPWKMSGSTSSLKKIRRHFLYYEDKKYIYITNENKNLVNISDKDKNQINFSDLISDKEKKEIYIYIDKKEININNANLPELYLFEIELGIPELSRKIQVNRPYATPEDLVVKKVITQEEFNKIKDQVIVVNRV